MLEESYGDIIEIKQLDYDKNIYKGIDIGFSLDGLLILLSSILNRLSFYNRY